MKKKKMRIRSKKRRYTDLGEPQQKKFLQLMTARYAYKGAVDPELTAKKDLAKRYKSTKAWRTLAYFLMVSVDKHRQEMGLDKVHFPDKKK